VLPVRSAPAVSVVAKLAEALARAEEARAITEGIAVANAYHDDGTWKAEVFGHADRAGDAIAAAQHEIAALVQLYRQAKP
jgi:hypothetical protein